MTQRALPRPSVHRDTCHLHNRCHDHDNRDNNRDNNLDNRCHDHDNLFTVTLATYTIVTIIVMIMIITNIMFS